MKSFVALLIALLLFVSLCGYGFFLHTYLLGRRKEFEYLIPGLGVSSVVLLGGYLNVFHQAGRVSSIMIFLFGLFLAIWVFLKNVSIKSLIYRPLYDFKSFLLQTLATLVVLYFYILGVLNRSFNVHDDYEGYFVFAAKLKQLGTLGDEFFSERRLVTSVGGQSFIDSFSLTFLDLEFAHASDLGIGFLALVVSVALFLKSKGWSSSQIGGATILICLINPMTVNITSKYMLTLLIFNLLAFVADRNIGFRFSHQITVAMISTAGMTLKNSAVPFLLGVLVLYSVLTVSSRPRNSASITNPLLLYLFTLIFWFPWGLELYRSFGTFQYPLLGRGNHGSAYGTFAQNSDIFDFRFIKSLLTPILYAPTSSILLSCTVILMIWLWFSSPISNKDRRILIYVLGLLFLFYISFTIATDGYSIYRYIFPMLFAFFLYLLHFLHRAKLRILGIVFVLSLTLSISQLTFMNSGYSSITSRMSINGISDSNVPNPKQKVDVIQELLPRDSRVLLRTSFNFLFDFKRNDYQIADYPGAASPPPGLPNFGTKLDMENYLRSQGVDFVIFQYKGLFEKENFSDRLTNNYNRWLKAEAANAFAFHDRMVELSQDQVALYDDGEVFVLRIGKGKA
jgi:hypothetical protein